MEGPPFVAVLPHGAGGRLEEVRNFDVVGTATPGAGATLNVVTFRMPPRAVGVLLWFGQSVLDTDAWASLTWRVQLDGGTVEGLNFTTRVGMIAAPTPVYAMVRPSQLVAVNVTNAGGAGFAACARIKGFFWPAENQVLGAPRGSGASR